MDFLIENYQSFNNLKENIIFSVIKKLSVSLAEIIIFLIFNLIYSFTFKRSITKVNVIKCIKKY